MNRVEGGGPVFRELCSPGEDSQQNRDNNIISEDKNCENSKTE